MNKPKRQEALIDILNKWIDNDEMSPSLGQLVIDGSFQELHDDVIALRRYGRTDKWQNAVNEALSGVEIAHKTFYGTWGPDVTDEESWELKHSAFTRDTAKEMANMLKWAVLKMSTHCWNI